MHRVLIVTLRKEFVTIHSPPLSSKTLLVSKIKQPIRKIGDRGRYISSLNSSYGEISPFPRGPADDPSPHPEDKLTNFSPRISRRSSIRVSYDFQPREEWLIVPIVSSPRLSPTSDRLIILSPPSPLRGDAKSGVEIATNYPLPPILTFVNRCPRLSPTSLPSSSLKATFTLVIISLNLRALGGLILIVRGRHNGRKERMAWKNKRGGLPLLSGRITFK